MSPERLSESWSVEHEVGGVVLTLPKAPDTLDLPDGSGRVIVSDEFGDAFGVLAGAGTSGNLSFAFGRALDRLFDVEWGEAPEPELTAASLSAAQATFSGFGQDYVACWRELDGQSGVWLFAVVPPGREPLAKAFVEGASVGAR